MAQHRKNCTELFRSSKDVVFFLQLDFSKDQSAISNLAHAEEETEIEKVQPAHRQEEERIRICVDSI